MNFLEILLATLAVLLIICICKIIKQGATIAHHEDQLQELAIENQKLRRANGLTVKKNSEPVNLTQYD